MKRCVASKTYRDTFPLRDELIELKRDCRVISCYHQVRCFSSAEAQTEMRDRITVKPEVHFGKPCVSGTRIPVQSVLELVREGLTFADITRDYYPDISPEDIKACLQYAIDVVAVEDIHFSTTS